MKKNIFILLLISILVSNCSDKNERVFLSKKPIKYFINDFGSNDTIKFEKFCEYTHGDISDIFLIDSSLILGHFSSNNNRWFRILDSHNGTELDSFMNFGKGSKEALGITCSGLLKNNTFWAYDATKKELWQYKDVLEHQTFVKSKVNRTFYRMDLLNNDTFIANGNFESDYKFDKYSLNEKRVLKSFGSFESLPEYIPISVCNQLANSDIKIKPDMTKFAVAYHYFDLIEIYSIEGELITAIKGPINSSAKFNIRKGMKNKYMSLSEKSIFCFPYLFTTDKYIYASFSGKPFLNEDGQPDGEYCNNLFMYDWEGNLLKSFTLNDKVMPFYVNEEDSTIFSYSYISGNLIKGKISF